MRVCLQSCLIDLRTKHDIQSGKEENEISIEFRNVFEKRCAEKSSMLCPLCVIE